MANETRTEKALREAIATARRDAREPDPTKRTGGELVNYGRVVAAARADERAKLAAAVPPMTEMGEGKLGDHGYEEVYLVEIDALRAALAAEREAHAKTKGEEADADRVRELIAKLLRGTANGLKGQPPPLMMWDWSDLPVVASEVRAAAIKLMESVERDDPFRLRACKELRETLRFPKEDADG